MSSSLEKALDYAKSHPFCGIVFEVECDLGRCKTLVPNDPMMKSWQLSGFDSAWSPHGANSRGFSENCVKDPARVHIVRIFPGDTAKLHSMGMGIDSHGHLCTLNSLHSTMGGSRNGCHKRKHSSISTDSKLCALLLKWKLGDIEDQLVAEGIDSCEVLVTELDLKDIPKMKIGILYQTRLRKLTVYLRKEEKQKHVDDLTATSLLACMKTHNSNAAELTKCYDSLVEMQKSGYQMEFMVNAGLLPVIFEGLETNKNELEVVRSGFSILSHFDTGTVLSELVVQNAIPIMVAIMKSQSKDEAVLASGLKIMHNIIKEAPNHTECATKMFSVELIGILLHAMKDFAENECLNLDACLVLEQLSNTAGRIAQVVEVGALPVIISTLARFSTIAAVQSTTQRVLGVLVEENHVHMKIAVEAGVLKVVAGCIRDNMQNVLALQQSSKCIFQLTSMNVAAFGHRELHNDLDSTEIISIFTSVLKTHVKCGDIVMQYVGLFASMRSPNFRNTIQKSEAIGIIYGIMVAPSQAIKIRSMCCSFFANLAQSAECRVQIFALNVVSEVMEVMVVDSNNMYTQQMCCMFLYSFLADESSQYYEYIVANQDTINIKNAMTRYQQNAQMQLLGFQIIRCLARELAGQNHIMFSDSITVVLIAMKTHEDNARIQIQGMCALRQILLKNSTNQIWALENNIVGILVQVANKHMENLKVIIGVCSIYYIMILTAPFTNAMIKDKAVNVFLEIMTKFPNVAGIQDYSCILLYKIAINNKDVREYLVANNATAVVSDIVKQKKHSPECLRISSMLLDMLQNEK